MYLHVTRADQSLSFASCDEARVWVLDQVDDCVDNHRFAFEDDVAEMAAYQAAQEGGCCGFFDAEIQVDGRNALIGCNYGH